MNASPAGWYPQEDGRQRYWDGQQWTEHFAPGSQQAPGATRGAAPGAPHGGMPQAAATPRPWFKKKRVLIPAALLAVGVVGAQLGGGSGGSTPATGDVGATKTVAAVGKTQAPAAPAKEAPAASQIGQSVRDGKFKFVVKSVKCGIATVGQSEYLKAEAQGQFCAVALTVENIGDEAQSMFADNQLAFDAKGRKFSADRTASLYDGSSKVLWEKINPGNAIKGTVYFDVPKGTTLTSLELHDSMFSGGVKVKL